MIELRGLHLGNIARSPNESVRPDLWPDHAWVPALGCTGSRVFDLCGGLNGIFTSPLWGTNSAEFSNNGYVHIGNEVLKYSNNFTLVIDYDVTVAEQFDVIFCAVGPSGAGWRLWTRDSSSQKLYFSVKNALSADFNTISSANFIANDRVAVGVYSEHYISLYSDGLLDSTPTYVTGGITYYLNEMLSKAYIGCMYTDRETRFFSGRVRSALTYDRALSSSDIQSISADPILPFRRRQQVYYSVPSGGGTARSLIAALTGESATGTISAIIARALSGDVTATSITGAITASMARDLLASLQGQSTTGDVAATLQRLLLASLGGASTTGDVAATMSGIVSLIAAINGQSATGSAAATQAVALLADLQASSATPDIAATLAALVALTANISGTTTTPAVAATMARALAANLAGQSTTGAVAVEFAGMLLLVASIAGTSTTGALTATTGRELRAAIATASSTGTVDGQLLRQVAATVAGASLTGAIAAELVSLVSLAASVVGVSVSPAVIATLSRDLAADVAAGSTTGEASATVARTLAAAVEAGSLTPDNLVLILTGLGILHDTTIISRTPRRGITSRTVRRTIHSA